MKALLMRYNRCSEDMAVKEIDCMYYTTAFDNLKISICQDLDTRFQEINFEKSIIHSYSDIKHFVNRLKIEKMFSKFSANEEDIDAIITISVTKNNGSLIGEYYIICSDYSFIKDVYEYRRELIGSLR